MFVWVKSVVFTRRTNISMIHHYQEGKVIQKSLYVVCCVVWYYLHNLKNMQNTHGVESPLHGCFLRFLNCVNVTKLRNTRIQIFLFSLINFYSNPSISMAMSILFSNLNIFFQIQIWLCSLVAFCSNSNIFILLLPPQISSPNPFFEASLLQLLTHPASNSLSRPTK